MNKIFIIIAIFISANLYSQPSDEQPKLNDPDELVSDSKDNLFVLMKYGIAKITPDGKVIDLRKQEGGAAIDKDFKNLIIDSKDNLFVSDGNNIYKITVTDENKVISNIYAGFSGKYRIIDGPIATAAFAEIHRMAMDKNDNIYLTDSYDNIAKEGHLDGKALLALFSYPKGLAYDSKGNLFISDSWNNCIRKLSPDGMVSSITAPLPNN